eukprot:7435607-Karenia_brevis.AAC.1
MPLALANNLLPLSLNGLLIVIVMSNRTGHALIDFSSIKNFDTNMRLKEAFFSTLSTCTEKEGCHGLRSSQRAASRIEI